MRIIFAGAAIALLSLASATPAFAQFGGSPAAQVDGAPGQSVQAPDQDDEDDQAIAPENGDIEDVAAGERAAAEGYGKPGADAEEGYAAAEIDADVDADVDQGDVDTEMDQGDANDGRGDVDEDADQDGGVAGGGDAAATWQGEDGRAYCRRSDGTTGLVVGGGAGALVGRGIDGGRHRGAGTIIGAIAGAVIGSAVERSANQQNCR